MEDVLSVVYAEKLKEKNFDVLVIKMEFVSILALCIPVLNGILYVLSPVLQS